MKIFFQLVLCFVVLLSLTSKFSIAGQIYIPVGEARIKKSVVAFPETKFLSGNFDNADYRSSVRKIKETILSDLEFTNLFNLQASSAYIEKSDAGITLESFRITDWSTIGSEFLIKTGVSLEKDNFAYEVRLYDVLGTKQILGKKYVAKAVEYKILAHSAANDIVEALTGKPGIFFTKIAMTCDKNGRRSSDPIKEIWTMNFDGSNATQITNHHSLAFAPAWSPNNKKIAYTLVTKNSRNVKNHDLYELDVDSRKSRLLSNRQGINSGAAYSPRGDGIALTMSFLGNPEIFLLDTGSREVTRLTKSFGVDVDPAFSPDGSKLAFVSTRSNQPMVFTAPISELKNNPQNASRLTFAGKYNATPSWSPSGKKIAFAGFIDSHFDIFIMNTDGTGLERLTKNEGSNEDPHFSPDGNYIVFSSNRSGLKKIYIISIDGAYTRQLTYDNLGNCVAPKWSWQAKEPF